MIVWASLLCLPVGVLAVELERDPPPHCNVDRVRLDSITADEFQRLYAAHDGFPGEPLVILGALDDWPALQSWDPKTLYEKYGPRVRDLLRAAASGQKHGKVLSEYFHFDVVSKNLPELMAEWKRPALFADDLLKSLPAGLNPGLGWLLAGGPGTGTGWHTDIFNTSAYNALVKGRKRWFLWRPDAGFPPMGELRPSDLDKRHFATNSDRNAVFEHLAKALPPNKWYREIYPSMADQEKRFLLECDQNAGEVMYVPRGWWHLVVNLESTLVITENLVPDCDAEMVATEFSSDSAIRGEDIGIALRAMAGSALPRFEL